MLKASNLAGAAELLCMCLTSNYKLIYFYGNSSIKVVVAEGVVLRLLHKPTVQSATI